jgi:hypothetical protein
LAIYTDVSEAKLQYNRLMEKYKGDHLFKLFVECRGTWLLLTYYSSKCRIIFDVNLIRTAKFELGKADISAYEALFDYIFTDKEMILDVICNINNIQCHLMKYITIYSPIRQFIHLLAIKRPEYFTHITCGIYLWRDYVTQESLADLCQLIKVVRDKEALIAVMAAYRADIDEVVEILADELKSVIYEDSAYRSFSIKRLVYLFEKGLVNIMYVLHYLMRENAQGVYDLIDDHWATIGRPFDQVVALAEEYGQYEVIEYITAKMGHGYIYENEFSQYYLLD